MVFDIYMFELMNNIQVKKVINSSKPIDNIRNDASGIIDKETDDVVQTDETLSTTEHIVRDDVSSKFFEEIQKLESQEEEEDRCFYERRRFQSKEYLDCGNKTEK